MEKCVEQFLNPDGFRHNLSGPAYINNDLGIELYYIDGFPMDKIGWEDKILNIKLQKLKKM